MTERSQVEDHLAALRTDVVGILRSGLGMDEPSACRAAEKIVGALRERLGGERVYIGVRNGVDRDAVLRDWNGRNVEETCAAHLISRRTLYRILKDARRAGLLKAG